MKNYIEINKEERNSKRKKGTEIQIERDAHKLGERERKKKLLTNKVKRILNCICTD